MNVEFWFDPGCPFTWITSRWIQRVAPERDLDVTWRSFSLLIKNNPPDTSPFYPKVLRTKSLLRVAEAANAAGQQAKVGDLYTEFGRHIHSRDDLNFDVTAVLEKLELDPALAEALEQASWDAAIEKSMADGLGLAGVDVGVPIIALDSPNGRVGFSGPILTKLPNTADSVALWDAFVTMTSTPGFFEVKRNRDEGPVAPDESEIG